MEGKKSLSSFSHYLGFLNTTTPPYNAEQVKEDCHVALNSHIPENAKLAGKNVLPETTFMFLQIIFSSSRIWEIYRSLQQELLTLTIIHCVHMVRQRTKNHTRSLMLFCNTAGKSKLQREFFFLIEFASAQNVLKR